MSKLLVIDDDRGVLDFISSSLPRHLSDCAILTADNQKSGLELAEREVPDVILLDVVLHEVDGFKVCEELKTAETTRNIPVVLMTGVMTDPYSRANGLNWGADAYLNKPFDSYELAAQIRSMLRIKENEKGLRAQHEKLQLNLRQTVKDLGATKESFNNIFGGAKDAILIHDFNGTMLDINDAACALIGFERDMVIGRNLLEAVHPDDSHLLDIGGVHQNAESRSLVECRFVDADGSYFSCELSQQPISYMGSEAVMTIARNISERKLSEKRQEVTEKILTLLNQRNGHEDLIQKILQVLREFTGFEAVGIRLKDNGDYPYYCTMGFSSEFVEYENSLCGYDHAGEIIRDKDGYPVWECMCGNVINGRTDSTLPFFTPGGSFWTNSTSELLLNTTEDQRQGRTRNRCNKMGYESMALIPLRADDQTIGLIQINDKRVNLLTEDDVRFLEGIGASVGIALGKTKSEKAILSAKQEWESTFDSIDDLVIIVDEDFEIVRANQAAASFSGLPVESLVGTHCYELHGRNAPPPWCPHAARLRDGHNHYSDLSPSKSGAYFHMTAAPIKSAKTDKICSVCMGRDITEMVLIRQELETHSAINDTLAKLGRSLLAQLPVAEISALISKTAEALTGSESALAAYVDLDTNELVLPASGCEPPETSCQEEESTQWLARLVEDIWEKEKERYFHMIKGQKAKITTASADICGSEKKMIASFAMDGGKVAGLVVAGGAKDDYNQADTQVMERLAGIYGLALKRLWAENALKSTLEEKANLLDSVPTVMIGLNDKEEIVYWNKAAEETLGKTASEMLGHCLRNAVLSWDQAAINQMLDQYKDHGRGWPMDDMRYSRTDGKDGVLVIGSSVLRQGSSSEAGLLINAKDVTERRLLEGQLLQAQKLESIGQLAAGIAHEINTPAQYVGDNTRFTADGLEDLGAVIKSYQEVVEAVLMDRPSTQLAKAAQRNAEELDLEYLIDELPKASAQSLEGIGRISTIVRAMKDFSHPGNDALTPVDLNRAIESTITVSRNEWKYVADMETDLDPHLPMVPCIVDQFNQVILNLVVNAAHAIESVVGDGGELKGTIRVSTRQDGKMAEVRITDTGPGIPENIRNKVFDPFFTTKEVGRGTGQGLAIARSVIAERHQGELSFESKTGQGTTFIIRLPLENPQQA